MNTIPNIIPHPPQNCKILYPKYKDSKNNTWSEYQSTGYFLESAEKYKRQGHEAKATAFLLDCDLVDFLMEEHELSLQQRNDQLDAKKHEMYTADVQTLIDLKNRFLKYLEDLIIDIGVEPSVCSWSGWGVHLLWWVPEEMGWHQRTGNAPTDQPEYIDFDEIAHRQREFTTAVNKFCGFHFTDAACKDAGTRLLRPLGSFNRKAPERPIEVKIVDDLSTGNRISTEQLTQLTSWARKQLDTPSTNNNRPPAQQVAPENTTSTRRPQQARQNNNDDNNTGGGDTQGRFRVEFVPGDIQINLGDNVFTTFQEIIDNWDNYHDHNNFRPATGRLQVVSPGSQNTVGSAFIFRQLNLLNNFHIYTMTSNRNRTHYRSYTSHNGVYLDFGRQGDSGKKVIYNAANIRKILLSQSHDYVWNQRTMQCLRDGKELTNEDFVVLAQTLETRVFQTKKIDPKVAQRALLGACMENQIDPLKDYLNNLPPWDQNDRISTLFQHYLKSDEHPLYKVYAEKFLVACIARAFQWGCKVDTCLVLKGEQGVRKSGFFRTICGDKFFLDESIDISNKDGKSLLKQGWFIEFAELESMNGKDVKIIKSFLTKQSDTYRPPYGTKEDKIPRRNVFVGTTNEDRFLKDSTGSRRFWIVECGGEPNTPVYDEVELSANRDQIWSQALHYYNAGHEWWLTKEEELMSVDHKEKYQVADPHEEILLEWIDSNPDRTFSIPEMIQEAYNITEETDYGSKTTQKVIKPKSWKPFYSEILPKLGCLSLNNGKRYRHEGKRGRWWQTPPVEPPPQSSPPPSDSSSSTSQSESPIIEENPEIKMDKNSPLPKHYDQTVKTVHYEGPNVSKVDFKNGSSKTFIDMTMAEKKYWMKKSSPIPNHSPTQTTEKLF